MHKITMYTYLFDTAQLMRMLTESRYTNSKCTGSFFLAPYHSAFGQWTPGHHHYPNNRNEKFVRVPEARIRRTNSRGTNGAKCGRFGISLSRVHCRFG